jgi:Flp pilus assembly protein TadD
MFIQRRQGHWEECTRNLERAAELDPRDRSTLETLSSDYASFRRYAEAKTWLTRAVAVAEPDDIFVEVATAGDWLLCALAERDATAAREALSALGNNEIWLGDQVQFNRAFVEGLIARMTNDEHNAQLKKIVETQPDFGLA